MHGYNQFADKQPLGLLNVTKHAYFATDILQQAGDAIGGLFGITPTIDTTGMFGAGGTNGGINFSQYMNQASTPGATNYSQPNNVTPSPANSSVAPNSSNMQNGGWYNGVQYWAPGQGTSTPPSGGSSGGSSGSSTPNYDSLISQINSIADQGLSALDPQKASQEAIANNSYNQGVSDLTAQQTAGNAQLDTTRRKANENQVKTLTDLTENMRNLFNSGANILGARGAGDSSAANQYAYALTQMGNKNRGNVMSQTTSIMNDINDRANQLQLQVTQGIKQLDTEKANALQGIASWYSNAQNQIRQTKGQNVLQLGQQALSQAMSALQSVQANYQNQQNSLMQWAENNATTINGLKSNLQQVAQFSPTMPTAGSLTGLSGGSVNSSGGYVPGNASTSTTDKNIFGF